MQKAFGRRQITLLVTASFLFFEAQPVAAHPIGDFFKRLGNSIAHPQKKPPARTTAKKNGSKANSGKGPAPLSSPAPQGEVQSEVPPPAQPTPQPTATPVRQADGLARPTRRDMPYGVPVPGRPGFVTSPYAPTLGLVDVRNFPSGTEVKDPYTGKIFLTP